MRILLTGATGGIGSALARVFAADGAHLLLQGRNQERLDALVCELGDDRCLAVSADLTRAEDCARLIDAASGFDVDTLCNNAGINSFSSFANTDIAALINTNVTATLTLTQGLLPQLMSTSAPRVITIGSAFGSIGYPGYATYCASKFALRGFSEALQREYADTALEVFYLAPRATATPMNDARIDAMNHDLGNSTDSPETVAKAVLGALHKGRHRLQIGGSKEALQVHLNSILPGLVDRAISKQLPTIKQYLADGGTP